MTEIKTNGPDYSFANVPYPQGTEPSPFANVPLSHPSGRELNAFDSLPPVPQLPADGSPVSWGTATVEGPGGQPEPWWVESVRQRESTAVALLEREQTPTANNEWWRDPHTIGSEPNEFATITLPEQTNVIDEASEPEEQDYRKRELELAPVPETFTPQPNVVVEDPGEYFHIQNWRKAGVPIPAEYYDRLGATGSGWKLHLNFDYTNPQVVKRVQEWLNKATAEGLVAASKIGNGGGAEAEEAAAGKEATLAIGHRDKAQMVAERIAHDLGDILLPQTGHDVSKHDVPIFGNIWGRFNTQAIDPDFHQYGRRGIPMLNQDMGQVVLMGGRYKGLEGVEARDQFWEDAATRTEPLVKYRYGEFYTGTKAA